VREADTELPQASVAVHVMTRWMLQPEPLSTKDEVTVTPFTQLSVAVTLKEFPVGTLPQSTEELFGKPTSTGAVVSTKVVVCEAEVVLPQASVAVQVRTSE
jgi:hypothetical protein